MKRSQNGSAGSVVVIVVLAVLLWWKWDAIWGFLGPKLSMGGSAVVELVDYRCDKQSGGILIDGRVRNPSDKPIELRAVTAIYDSSGKKSDYREATVRPVPVPPGQVGDFRTDGPPLPDGGYCKLDGFIDTEAGHPVKYTGRH